MNYKERIQALKDLKSSLIEVENTLDGVHTEVSDWTGDSIAKTKFTEYIDQTVKKTFKIC